MEHDFDDKEVPRCSFGFWIFDRIKKFAEEKEKIAQIFADDGTSWTYGQLLQNSVRVATGLKSLGFNPGDKVSFVARNSHELFGLAIGCIISGVVTAPSIAELSPNELKQNFDVIKPKFIIAGVPSLAAVEEAVKSEENPPKIFELKQLYRDAITEGSSGDPATFEPIQVDDSEYHVFACYFTSGTTGKQKAVGMADFGCLRSTYKTSRFEKLGPCVAFSPTQLNWVSWWVMEVRCLLWGWTRIFADEFDLLGLLDIVHRFKPSVFCGLPSMLACMANIMDENPGRWDLTSIKHIFVTGEIMNEVSHERFCTVFNAKVCQEYGLTECGVSVQNPLDLPIVYGSSGRPIGPIKLVDLDTREEITEPNKSGEVIVKWLASRGYVNNAEATENAFDKNGWFKTGDIAFFDESGNYFFIARDKDAFKYLGYQIIPNELEAILITIPGVKEVAVVGKNAGVEIGQLPTAYIVKAKDADITEEDIHTRFENENLHDAKRLRGGVIFVDKIPKNPNGKVSKFRLREIFNHH